MSFNWYAVYTRPQKERKVITTLLKKGINCFCPLIAVKEGRGEFTKVSNQPLFSSLVFVQLTQTDIKSLLAIPFVVTIAYWKSKPAVISNSEIDIIKNVIDIYSEIKLEKDVVEIDSEAKIIDSPAIEYKENTIAVKYKSLKVKLPSLGFVLCAERIKQKAEIIYPQASLFSSFPKRFNAFFFN